MGKGINNKSSKYNHKYDLNGKYTALPSPAVQDIINLPKISFMNISELVVTKTSKQTFPAFQMKIYV